MRTRIRSGGVLALLAAALLVTGCTTTAWPFEDLPAAQLPAHIDRMPDGTLIEGSLRYLGEGQDGTTYHVSRWDSDLGPHTCLHVSPTDGRWTTGCTTGLPLEVGVGPHAVLYDDPARAEAHPDATEILSGFLVLTG